MLCNLIKLIIHIKAGLAHNYYRKKKNYEISKDKNHNTFLLDTLENFRSVVIILNII